MQVARAGCSCGFLTGLTVAVNSVGADGSSAAAQGPALLSAVWSPADQWPPPPGLVKMRAALPGDSPPGQIWSKPALKL